MNTRKDRRDLVRDLAERSRGVFRHAAVLSDNHGIFSWGWNHDEVHAEEHAIRRANRRRLSGSTMTLYGKKRSGKVLLAKPCERRCRKIVEKFRIGRIEFSDPSTPDGWQTIIFGRSG